MEETHPNLDQTPLDLSALRERINEIDSALVPLIIERRETVTHIGDQKKARRIPVRDTEREQAQMLKLAALCIALGKPESVFYVTSIFRLIIDSSVRLEENDNPRHRGHSSGNGSQKRYFCIRCDWTTEGVTDNELNAPQCFGCKQILAMS